MAKLLNLVNVNLAFTADTSKAKAQLLDLQRQLTNIVNAPTSSFGTGLATDIQKATTAAAELKVHLLNATNVNTGTLDFPKLNLSIKLSGTSLEQYAMQLRSLGPIGQQAFMALADSVAQAEVPIKRSNALVTELWTSLKNTARWQISSSVLHGFMGAIQGAYGYAQDLNKSLNDIRIVTGYNTEQMANFADSANKAAKALSTTTTEYTNASLIYFQLGLSDEEVAKRTEVTIKMANAAGVSAETVSDQLTAVWNNFYDGSKSLEYYADVMTALGAATASSTDEISEGLNKFAAVAETVGLSYEYATSALATVTATTRESADVVGTAFKTLFARIQGLTLGETLDDGTDLNKYSEALAKVGISIFETNGEMKAMDNILNEMGTKWLTLGRDQQTALAQTVAGVRQYTQLVALMDNWTYFQENLGVATGASGALQEQADIYAESWEAASDRVRTAWEGIYDNLVDDKFFINLLGFLEDTITGFDKLIDSVGGLGGVLSTLGVIATKVFSNQIAQGLSNMAYTLKMSTLAGQDAETRRKEQFLGFAADSMAAGEKGETKVALTTRSVYKEQLLNQQLLVTNAKNLSEEEKRVLQLLLDLNKARGEEAIAAAKVVETTLAKRQASATKLHQGAEKALGDKYNYGETEKRIEALRKVATALTEVEMAINKTQLAISITGLSQNELELAYKDFTGLEKISSEALQVMQDMLNLDKSNDQYEQSLQELGTKLGEIARKDVSIQGLTNAFEEFYHMDKENGKQAFTFTEKEVTELIEQLKTLDKETDDYKQTLIKLQGIANKEMNYVVDLASTKPKTKMGRKAKKKAKKAGLDVNEETEENPLYVGKKEDVQGYVADVQANVEANHKLAASNYKVAISSEAFKLLLEQTKKTMANWSLGIVLLSSGLLSVVSAASSLKGAMDALTDPDLSGWEKFSSVMQSALMGITMLISGISSLILVKDLLDLKNIKQNATTALNTAATWLNAKAEENLAKAKAKTATSSKFKTEMLEEENKELGKTIVLNKGAQASEGSSGGTGGSVPKGTEGAAGGVTLGGALKSFGSSLTSFLPAIAAVAGAIALVTAAVGISVALFNQEADAAKNASILAEEASATYEEARAKYEELKTNAASYQSAVDGLSEMTRGTEEWKDAIDAANEEALKLLDTYEGLKYTVSGDGLIIIDEESLANAQEAARIQKQMSHARSMAASQYADTATMESRRTNFARETLDSGEGRLLGLANFAASTAVGTAAGALIGSAIPVIGTAIGAGVGALAGAVTGLVGAVTAGSDAGEEQKAIDKLVNAYEKNEGALEAVFKGNDENIRSYLLQELKINDTALIDSLIKNKDATLDLVKSQAELNESIKPQNLLYSLEINANNAGYQASEAKEYIDVINAELMGVDLTDAEVEKKIDEMSSGFDDYSEYEQYLKETTGEEYRVVDKAGTKATLLKKNDEGTWETVGEKNTLTWELVATELLKYEKGRATEEDIAKGERDQAEIEGLLIAAGISEEMANTIGAAYYKGDSFDVSGIETRAERDAILNNLDSIQDLELRQLVAIALKSWSTPIESLTSITNKVLTRLSVYDMKLGESLSEEEYLKLPPDLLQLFAENLDGTWTLVDLVTDINGKMPREEQDKIDAGYRKLLEDYEADRTEASRLISAGSYSGLGTYLGTKADTNDTTKQDAQVDFIYEFGNYTYDTLKEEYQARDGFHSLGWTDFLAQMVREVGASAKTRGKTMWNNAQNNIDQTLSDWALSALSTDHLEQLLAEGAIDLDNYQENIERVLLLDVQREGIDLEEWVALTEVLQDTYGTVKRNDQAAKDLSLTYFRFTNGLTDLSTNFESYYNVLTDVEAKEFDVAKATANLRKDLLTLFGPEFSADLLSKSFLQKQETLDLLKAASQGDMEALGEFLFAATQNLVRNKNDETQGVITELNDYFAEHGDDIVVGARVDLARPKIKELFENLAAQEGMTEELLNSLFLLYNFESSVATDLDAGKLVINWEQTRYRDPEDLLDSEFLSGLSEEAEVAEPDQVDLTLLEDELERYKEINDTIDDITRSYDNASKAAERLYGTNKVDALRKSNEKLKQSIDDVNAKTKEAEGYLSTDKADLKSAMSAAGVSASLRLDSEGNIDNYDTIMKLAVETLNAEQTKYNNMTAEQQEDYKGLEEAQEAYDKLKEAIAQYDETRELIEDLEDEAQDKLYEWQDNNLEILNLELELDLKVDQEALDNIDYSIQKLGDGFYESYEAGALLASLLGPITQIMGDQNEQMDKLKLAYAAEEISPQAFEEGMQASKDAIREQLNALISLEEEMKAYYGDTLSKASEELGKYTDRMEHVSEALDHYKNMMGILGRETDYSAMGKILETQAKASEDLLKVSTANYKEMTEQAELAYQKLQEDPTNEILKANWEAAEQAQREAQLQMLADTEEWAEAQKAILENELSGLGQSLENALTGGTSFDQMNTALDRASSLQEEYLTTTNKIYETTKMMRTAQNAIDATNNTVAKNRLKNFINETQQLQDQTQLSQYELDIQQAKYDLLLAEIALEEAQSAKSTVRLQRDAEGNFGYVYTADQNKIAEAQQQFEDALNSLYNLSLQGTNDYTQKYQQTLSEMYDTLTSLNEQYRNGEFESEQEYQNAVLAAQQYYYEQLENFADLYHVAVTTDSRAIEEAWSGDFESMMYSTDKWKVAANDYVEQTLSAFNEFNEEMKGQDGFLETLDEMAEKSQDLVDEVTKDGGVIDAMGEELDAVLGLTGEYAKLLDVLKSTFDFYEKLIGIKDKYTESPLFTDENGNAISADGEAVEDNTLNDTLNIGGVGKQSADVGKGLTESATTFSRGDRVRTKAGVTTYTDGDRMAKWVANGNTPRWVIKVNGDKVLIGDENLNYTGTVWAKDLERFNTGGYTGDWSSPGGKLGILDKKEIILNANDSENFLASLDLLRDIVSVIDVRAASAQFGGLLSSPFYGNTNNETLEQNVKIEATFPNVTNHSEIEEAFNNLINTASQYANR